MLILYVDDEPGLLEIGKLLLEQSGEFHVDTCTSARAALEILNKKNYDVIISDYLMPEMDGIEFLKRVRATGSTIPFIIFTGRGTEKVVIDALNNGADFYLQKEDESKVLFAELTHAIRQSVLMRQNCDKLGQKEQALRESEQKFRAMVEQSNEGIVIVDFSGILLFANRRAMDIIENASDKDLTGKLNVLDFVSPELRKDAVRDFMQVSAGTDRYLVSYKIITLSNKERWIECIGKKISFKGSPGMLLSFRDVTERRQIEEELRASEERYRALYRDNPTMFFTLDSDGKVVSVNPFGAGQLGYTVGELEGQSVLNVFFPEDRQAVTEQLQVCLRSPGQVFTWQFRKVRKDGSLIWVEESARAMINPQGDLSVLVVCYDITKRKKAERDLFQKNEELNAANEQLKTIEEELRANYDALLESQRKVEESEDRYRRLVENANEAIFVIQDGRICFVNQKVEEIGMYTKEELAAKPFLEFVHPEDRAMVGEQHQRRLAGEILQHSYTFRILSKTGSVLWMEINSSLITWEKRPAVLILLSDITERKRAEEALRQSEEKYRSIIENIQDVYYRTDASGNLLFASPSAEKMFGFSSASEFYGKNIAETLYYKPEDRKKFLAELNKTGSVTEYEVMLKKLDGTPLLVSTSSHNYYDSSGKFLGVEGIFRDITDRKRADDALHQSEEKYRALFENTGTAMALIEENTIISLVNAELERLSEYSKHEIEGKKSWNEFIVKEDLERMLVQHRLRRENRESALRNYEFRAITKSGRILNALLTIDIIPGTKRSIASMIDITEQKQTEKAFSQAIKKLNLLSSITRHDILNQLTVLEGYLALSEGSLDETAVLAEYIQKEITAAKIIERMIGFTRDYQDMGVNAPFWQDVNTSIRKAAAAFPLRKVRVEVDRIDLEVFADPLLERVFYNLIDNTLKHGGEKITTIRFSFHESDQWMNIVYEDDGMGVSGDMKKYLFVRGFGKHTGFGLYLIREILDITGITIRETGEPGKGARFEILVPKGIYRIVRP
jgi:PAS domain S-box-containing protein